MSLITFRELEKKYGNSDSRWLFRGQVNDYGALVASAYRDMWGHRRQLPNQDDLLSQIDQSSTTVVSSRDVAEALVVFKARIDRYFRFGFPVTRFMDIFFPKILRTLQSDKWEGTLGHLMAFHQHIGMKTTQMDFSWNPLIAAWFACHKWNGHNYSPVDETVRPVLYILDTEIIGDRVRDLRILPEFILRPHRQEGATIGCSFLEDLHSFVMQKVYIDNSGLKDYFQAHGLSEAYRHSYGSRCQSQPFFCHKYFQRSNLQLYRQIRHNSFRGRTVEI